ncbi:hypothetical protein ACJIZ3_008975 [Penstemon smallii]|uniref:Transposase-associated domain-containing protein n=1 Tax=Penstemon smallii TaxID=265156 RepID=A0ABD3TBC2_9LAMI
MDKSWIDEKHRFSSTYINGVESFLKFSMENAIGSDNKILCPCNECRNIKHKNLVDVKRDLHLKGFCIYYKDWIFHREHKIPRCFSFRQNSQTRDHLQSQTSDSQQNENLVFEDQNEHDDQEIDELFDMIGEIRDAEIPEHSFESNTENYERLLSDVKRELYPGCKYSLLSFIVKLLQIKVKNKMTNKTVDMILELFKDVLPEAN